MNDYTKWYYGFTFIVLVYMKYVGFVFVCSLLIFFGLLLGFLLGHNTTFAYQRLLIDRLDGKNINVVEIDMRDGQHILATSLAFTGGDTLENLTKKFPGATASINGAFFCPKDYSYCNNQTTTISERIFGGEAKQYSKYRPDTGIRAVFGVDKYGKPYVGQNNLGYISGLAKNTNSHLLEDFMFGLGNRPVILLEGEDVVAGSEDHMDAKIRGNRTQSFICHTQDANKIYFGTISTASMYQMPGFLQKHFDCYNAINLDAGSSIAMIVDDRVIKRSQRRNIMDAFVVVPRELYEIMTSVDLPEPQQTINLPQSYQLSSQEQSKKDAIIEGIMTELARRTPDRARKVRQKIINTLYRLLEHPKVTDTIALKTIIQEVILALITVDTL